MDHYQEKIAKTGTYVGKFGEKVIEFWEVIDAETVRHLYNSIQGRLEKVKSSKGAIIGY